MAAHARRTACVGMSFDTVQGQTERSPLYLNPSGWVMGQGQKADGRNLFVAGERLQ